MIFSSRWAASIVALTRTVCGEYVATANNPVYDNRALGQLPQHRFYSSEESSPVLQINVWNESAISSEGSHIFLRQSHYAVGTSSPVVLDAKDLSTVYVDHSFEGVYGTRVQENLGKKYLTFWSGQKDDGFGTSSGFGLAYDENYRLVYNVSAHNIGRHADLHEFAFTGKGTVLVLAVEDVRLDTSKWPEWEGSSLKLMARDNVIQEIDLETNELVFSWRALDHVSPVDSFEPSGPYWDIFHTNSIQKVRKVPVFLLSLRGEGRNYTLTYVLQTEAGNYLVSMRHTHSIILIDGKTGKIIWTLGGRQNNFKELESAMKGPGPVASALSMKWQHHARFVPGTNEKEMTFFDNHATDTSQGTCRSSGTCSRGLRVAIDDSISPPTVQILRQYLHPADLQSKNQGSLQLLPQADNVLIGWGHSPSFTEHLASGETVMDVQFASWPDNTTPAPDNYRVYKMDWTATPWWDPSIAVRENLQGDLDVYASWNGATEVREWIVRGNDGSIMARARRTGFETRLPVGPRVWIQRIWVEALDVNGAVLRASKIMDLGNGGVTILKESEEEWTDQHAGARGSTNIGTLLFSGAGLVGLVLGVLYTVVWRRRDDYRYLDDDMMDSDSDTDVEGAYLNLNDLKHEIDSTDWDRFGLRSPYRSSRVCPNSG